MTHAPETGAENRLNFSVAGFSLVRSVVRILVSSTFLSRVSKVAIKPVGLRREHRARLLKRTNAKDDHDDQAAAADDDAADNDDDDADADDDDNAGDDQDDADAIPTFTTIYMSPFQSVAVLAFLYYFDAVFVCRRRIPTTVRKVREWYEKSVVRTVRKV